MTAPEVKEDYGPATTANYHNNLPVIKRRRYRWWFRVVSYIIFLLAGQTAATLLGRLYFDDGGNSKWMSTIVQSAGFPLLIPLQILFPKPASSQVNPSPWNLVLHYSGLGLFLIGANLMFSYGLLYLPVSTFSLLCATQLAFNAITSYFINSEKFTILVLNSLVLLTSSACLLAINAESESNPSSVTRSKYIIGFMCTVGASALYSLCLSLVERSFKKEFKEESFRYVLDMQFYTSLVATVASVVGLFASSEWRSVNEEMKNYDKGRVSYVFTLVWTAITWQFSSVGLIALIFEVSSLFSNVISTLGLPLVPVFAVIFFHEKMNGVKVIALILAIWGFLSYIYQYYLDDAEQSQEKRINRNEIPTVSSEIC